MLTLVHLFLNVFLKCTKKGNESTVIIDNLLLNYGIDAYSSLLQVQLICMKT